MKTTMKKPKDFVQKWYVVDAKDKVLGRLSTKVATILQGKNKPEYIPHQDVGDNVIIINAEHIVLTGNKLSYKKYYTHSGYIGGLKTEHAKDLINTNPAKMLAKSVYGMLPKNKLRKTFMSKLRVYTGVNHDHNAQKPEILEV